jgi:hypothetical protein
VRGSGGDIETKRDRERADNKNSEQSQVAQLINNKFWTLGNTKEQKQTQCHYLRQHKDTLRFLFYKVRVLKFLTGIFYYLTEK